MTFFKRLSIIVVTRLDRVVDQLENHDAVVQAVLADMQRKVAEAKVRCNRVRRERELVAEQVSANRDTADQWRRRARQCGRQDEARALDCLARARRAEAEIERLEARERGYTEASARLKTALATLEGRVAELRQKQVVMRARESTGRALSASAPAEQWGAGALDDVMERWEIKVLEAELSCDATGPAGDPLEKAFTERELKSELRAELDALLAEGHGASVKHGESDHDR